MEQKVTAVDFQWLWGNADLEPDMTNKYTGSLPAKNGTKGIFADIFRYKIWVSYDENEEPLINAAWYFGQNAYDLTDPAVITSEHFEASQEGAEKAVAWLQEAYDKA